MTMFMMAGCSSSDVGGTDDPVETAGGPGNSTDTPDQTDPNTAFPSSSSDIAPLSAIYLQDGYGEVNVIRVDASLKVQPGACDESDYTGCTLDDVIADTNHKDDFKPEVQIKLTADDFPDSGEFSNASVRQRGGTTRLAEQKSFRIKLDSKDTLWRNERRLLLNKHPYESTRIRNKVAFDLMSQIPNLRSMRTQFVNLWIDSGSGVTDFGLFTHVEAASKEYLKLRALDENDNLYKTGHFRFAQSDLRNVRVDEEGKPLDEKLFEQSLEIKAGKDHRKLVEMLTAFHDADQSFDQVLDKYFNRNNILTWVALNFLLHQSDAVTHNFILYNPSNSDKFYFLPWDYDGALVSESEPPNSMEHKDLQKRLFFGYARGIHNEFITRYYRQPAMHSRIITAAEELRRDYLTDEAINSRARYYAQVIKPFATRSPDIDYNTQYNEYATEGLARAVAENLSMMQNHYSVPMPPEVLEPVREGSQWLIPWTAAYDITGNSVSYELLISNSPNFEPDTLVVNQYLSDEQSSQVEVRIDDQVLPAGNWYVRVIARSSNDPARYWQVNDNEFYTDEGAYYGVLKFSTAD